MKYIIKESTTAILVLSIKDWKKKPRAKTLKPYSQKKRKMYPYGICLKTNSNIAELISEYKVFIIKYCKKYELK